VADELQGSDSWQRARKPSQKRSREQSILNACKELVGSIHPSDINTSMIAKAAEISPSGLYRYYPTKESILFAL
jgi:AcrR family transcriptional regulator